MLLYDVPYFVYIVTSISVVVRSYPLPNYDPIKAIHYHMAQIINIVSGDLIE